MQDKFEDTKGIKQGLVILIKTDNTMAKRTTTIYYTKN